VRRNKGSRKGVRREARVQLAKERAVAVRQNPAVDMAEIVSRIADWAGGRERALAWYRTEPLPAFGGRTAEAMVKEGKAAAVRQYLDHIASGGFG